MPLSSPMIALTSQLVLLAADRARRQLQGRWPKFPPAMRTNCASQESIGGTPSYVSLLTCLQMSNWK
jgi:hypothetical protein